MKTTGGSKSAKKFLCEEGRLKFFAVLQTGMIRNTEKARGEPFSAT